eukprot:6022920-Pyramimonas_sp.AAC.1
MGIPRRATVQSRPSWGFPGAPMGPWRFLAALWGTLLEASWFPCGPFPGQSEGPGRAPKRDAAASRFVAHLGSSWSPLGGLLGPSPCAPR